MFGGDTGRFGDLFFSTAVGVKARTTLSPNVLAGVGYLSRGWFDTAGHDVIALTAEAGVVPLSPRFADHAKELPAPAAKRAATGSASVRGPERRATTRMAMTAAPHRNPREASLRREGVGSVAVPPSCTHTPMRRMARRCGGIGTRAARPAARTARACVNGRPGPRYAPPDDSRGRRAAGPSRAWRGTRRSARAASSTE